MSAAPRFPRVRRLLKPDAFRAHLDSLGLAEALAFDAEVEAGPDAPLGQGLELGRGLRAGNRFAILPMEGWDGTRDGRPTELVRRRWRRFGESGAKWIWGGEAVAVRPDGRANPNQLTMSEANAAELAALREELVTAHRARYDTADDLVVGLQLTHSGRWARPDGEPAPRVAYRHPLLDARVGVSDDRAVLDDDELDALALDFARAGELAALAGFDFVDVKQCHGYLGHELLTAVDRPGRYGGDLEGRTRWLFTVIDELARRAPDLAVGVRLSIFDCAPFRPGPDGRGECEWPDDSGPYRLAFGGDGTGRGPDLAETHALVERLLARGVRMLCTTAGSPYYNPHVQRPAAFPPSDGYSPPEDPLCGVARQLVATAELTRRHPELRVVASGLSYLQEWLPAVGQHAVRTGRAHAIGLGRMTLSYPELPADVLAGRPLERKLVCRTFSDCTSAPRGGLVSGCYPLDPFYKERPEAKRLEELKRG